MPRKEEALAAIQEAFAGVERPANHELLHPESHDDMDLVELYETIRGRL